MFKRIGRVFRRLWSPFVSTYKNIRMLTWLLAGLGIGVWYIQKFKDWIYSDRFHLYFFICVSLAIIALIALYQAQKIIDGLVRLTFRFSGEPPRYSLVESKGRNLFEVGAAVLVNNSGDQTIKAKFSIKILIRKRIGWKSFEVKNTIQDAYGRYWQPEQKKEIP